MLPPTVVQCLASSVSLQCCAAVAGRPACAILPLRRFDPGSQRVFGKRDSLEARQNAAGASQKWRPGGHWPCLDALIQAGRATERTGVNRR